MPKVWWASQGATYKKSRDGGFLWAPLYDFNLRQHFSWNMLREVRAGDIVVNYADRHVRAIGRAVSHAYPSLRPLALEHESWFCEGTRVDLRYCEIDRPIHFQEFGACIRDLNIDCGPMNKHGKPKQGSLFRFTEEGLGVILRLAGISKFDQRMSAADTTPGAEHGSGEALLHTLVENELRKDHPCTETSSRSSC